MANTITFVDELESLYPDSTSESVETLDSFPTLHVPRGSYAGVQILIEDVATGVACAVSVDGDLTSAVYRMVEIPVEQNTGLNGFCEDYEFGGENPYVIRDAPFRIFEVLKPQEEVETTGSADTQAMAFTVQVAVPVETPPGEYTFQVDVTVGAETTRKQFEVKVHEATVPPVGENTLAMRHAGPDLLAIMTHWQYNFDVGIEIMDRWAAMMVKGRINAVDDFYGYTKGQNWHESWDSYGTHFIEGNFLATKSGSDLIVNGTSATPGTVEGDAALNAMITERIDRITTYNLQGRYWQHVADEPDEDHFAAYEYIRNLFRARIAAAGLDEVPIIEFVNGHKPDFAGLAEIWIVNDYRYESYKEFYDNYVESTGNEVRIYTPLGPGGKWINRLLDMERIRSVYYGWGFAANPKLSGYGDWSLNHFGDKTDPDNDPYESTVPLGETFIPPGDRGMIYPGQGDLEYYPLSTTRFEAKRIGFEDYELLQTIDDADDLIDVVFTAWDDYETDITVYRATRLALLRAASEQPPTVRPINRVLWRDH